MNHKLFATLLLTASLVLLTGCSDDSGSDKRSDAAKKPEAPRYAGYQQIKREAEEGNLNAQYNLGENAQTPEEAFYWYKKAAEQGDSNAQFFIGRMYQSGSSVPADNTKAIEWYTKSAAQNNQNAKDALKSLMPAESTAPVQSKK